MNRKAWDQIVSASAAVIAVAMIVLGGFAISAGTSDATTSRLRGLGRR
jgi:hypothetical protein